jgi:hypothetical protein
MKILVIDDNEFKFDNIKKILEKVDVEPEITWAKSRNSGLISILQHNVQDNDLAPFDMLICDNYLPIYDDDWETKPFGQDIVEEVRERFGLTDLPIVMCSSEPLEEFDYNYSIIYNSSVYMDPMFKEVIDDINDKKKTLVLTKINKAKL